MSYRVAVRTLCEFTAKTGDLDLRFTPSPTAQEGIAGHIRVAASRGPAYEKEISLGVRHRSLQVSGRADGYDPQTNTLEEIKTHRGDLGRQPANHRALHWAQAKMYGYLLCMARELDEVNLALVYFDIETQVETRLAMCCSSAQLKAFFEAQCECFIAWADQELAHRDGRDRMLEQLPFPQPAFRPGQRQLAEAVYRAAARGACLMAQAPTGIGKTLGTLFPQLKALGGKQLDKLFFLSARTPGRRVALDALASLNQPGTGPVLRVLELVARDKACEHPDKACHGASCPLAQGFYDRLPAARAAAVERAVLDQQSLRDVAASHQVCPYYLSQDLARWADVVVGDYNYYFDHAGLLYGLAQADAWRVCVLVDEAHNLLDRARGMYSAELDQLRFRGLSRTAPQALKKPLARLERCWNRLNGEQNLPYAVQAELPQPLLDALRGAISAISEFLGEHPDGLDAGLQAAYFDALRFCRTAEQFGEHSFMDYTRFNVQGRARQPRDMSRLCLRNVIPAVFLKPRFEQAHSVVLFSATLSPREYHARLLGLPDSTAWVDVESPFTAGQLSIHIADHISTRYQDREASLPRIIELMARQYQARPGNYLAFFSSFDYLQRALALLRLRCPEIPVWEQTRGMAEAERNAFLARFMPEGRGIGFAVLGGAFAEGIDLPGTRLIGAFIATLGLPQVNPVNEEIRLRLDRLLGAGYDYTYLYPGLQKVVQAAGRVIRSQLDSGVIHLMDDRYARAAVRRLMPGWWQMLP